MLISISGTRRGRPPRLRTQSITELLRPNFRPDLARKEKKEKRDAGGRDLWNRDGSATRPVPSEKCQGGRGWS